MDDGVPTASRHKGNMRESGLFYTFLYSSILGIKPRIYEAFTDGITGVPSHFRSEE